MEYFLFIDDIRLPPNNGKKWVIARTSQEAVQIVRCLGVPKFVSYDHDLGGSDTSITFIKWLIEEYLDKRITVFPKEYDVHSQNPVGAENIRVLNDSFIKFIS